MHELSRKLHAATEAPTPSRIDVEALIAGERLRRRRVRLMAGSAVLVAAVALAPTLLAGPGPGSSRPQPAMPAAALPPALCPVPEDPGRPSPESYDTVRPRPTEPPEDAVARLTGVLRPMLETRLPGDVTAQGGWVPRDCDLIQFTYDPTYQDYRAHAVLSGGGLTNYLVVTVQPTGTDLPVPCADRSVHVDCTSTRLADGSVLVSRLSRVGEFGHEQRSAQLRRADGTTVTVLGTNLELRERPVGRPTTRVDPPLLSLEQLAALAQEPGLTLHP
ncbi:hypothetical protein [Verrucosispora sp. WMMC514]|uniref:hypothetical protein n=1 Tax=Verrucosispora sp. WMMC514 TaxID=3015156 RepID=UPI00248B95FA|nr:hypothetical protein [Verrucosispora sp. WMMC514]WBB93720.1 hypothetical protein O7597_12460 [Verrucosispora sp. WMMC514]